jgi:AraC-like DNA-binding protein
MSQDRIVKFFRDPDLKHIELRYSHYRQEAFKKHAHDTYSIGIVKRGHTAFFHLDQVRSIGGGDIALINPGEVHACNPEFGSVLTYYMLYVEPILMQKIVRGLTGKDEGYFYFARSVIQDKTLFRTLNELCVSMFRASNKLEIASNVYEALSDLALKHGDRDYQPVELTGTAEMVRHGHDFLMDNLASNVSLQELASLGGLSPYHFLRAFRRQYGLPPHKYQLQQRVNLAKRLLADGQPIAQVAAEVGFADQSHFTRKFKAFVGATPRQYQLTSI